MTIGRFRGGIAAVIRSSEGEYLLLRRSPAKDFGRGVWECVTGRVDQGEGFAEALHREVREELGVEAQIELVLGTTHFYRGEATPENELIGVICLCTIAQPAAIRISAEHSEYRWLTAQEALDLLAAPDASTQWMRRVLERAEAARGLAPEALLGYFRGNGIELG